MWAIRAAPSATGGAAAADAVGSSASSTSGDSESWASCGGALRIDLDSGQAHAQPVDASGLSRLPIRFDLQWASCSALLPFS
ncbi:MAG: hypothetical protein ACK56I_37055, partial [bacterium]